jgi:hypothetical protein
VEEVLRLMQRGANNRHVGETRLNRESSRSHSVFTCTIEKSTTSDNGLKNVITSRLNLIDLAGGAGGRAAAADLLQRACCGWPVWWQEGPGGRPGRRRGPGPPALTHPCLPPLRPQAASV